MIIKNLILVYLAEPISTSNAPSAVPRVSLGIPIHFYFVYLSGTDGHPLWLRAMLEIFLEFRVS